MVEPFEFSVPGRAALLTSMKNQSDQWKLTIREHASRAHCGDSIQHPCAVDLTFSLTRTDFNRTGLHNLLKATLDGLGCGIFRAVPNKRGWWCSEDPWIHRLQARKIEASMAQVIVRVTPWDERLANPQPNPLIEVVGRPAVWIGSGVNEWIAKLERSLAKAAYEVPERLSANLDFRVTPEQMASSDIDNFCVPVLSALQKFCGKSTGRDAQRITRLTASKRPTPASDLGLGLYLSSDTPG